MSDMSELLCGADPDQNGQDGQEGSKEFDVSAGNKPDQLTQALEREIARLNASNAAMESQLSKLLAAKEPQEPELKIEDLDLTDPNDLTKLIQSVATRAVTAARADWLKEAEAVAANQVKANSDEEQFFMRNPELRAHGDYARFVAAKFQSEGKKFGSTEQFQQAVADHVRNNLGIKAKVVKMRGANTGGGVFSPSDDEDPKKALRRKLNDMAAVSPFTLGFGG